MTLRRIGLEPPLFPPVHVERLDEEALYEASTDDLRDRLDDARRQGRLLAAYIADLDDVLRIRADNGDA